MRCTWRRRTRMRSARKSTAPGVISIVTASSRTHGTKTVTTTLSRVWPHLQRAPHAVVAGRWCHDVVHNFRWVHDAGVSDADRAQYSGRRRLVAIESSVSWLRGVVCSRREFTSQRFLSRRRPITHRAQRCVARLASPAVRTSLSHARNDPTTAITPPRPAARRGEPGAALLSRSGGAAATGRRSTRGGGRAALVASASAARPGATASSTCSAPAPSSTRSSWARRPR